MLHHLRCVFINLDGVWNKIWERQPLQTWCCSEEGSEIDDTNTVVLSLNYDVQVAQTRVSLGKGKCGGSKQLKLRWKEQQMLVVLDPPVSQLQVGHGWATQVCANQLLLLLGKLASLGHHCQEGEVWEHLLLLLLLLNPAFFG